MSETNSSGADRRAAAPRRTGGGPGETPAAPGAQGSVGTDYSIDYPADFAQANAAANAETPVLDVRGLTIDYAARSGDAVPALRDVNLEILPGSMTAVVGESGSGKTTTASAVIGLLAPNAQVSCDSITLSAHGEDPQVDLSALSPRGWKRVRGRRIGYIPQDPGTSLNPVKTVGDNVEESLRLHTHMGAAARRARVVELLDRVGIDRAGMRADQYPHELSGGMRQRALIAAAIAVDPQLLIADEPTSALDVTVQKRILDLLDELRREAGTGILFITHDLAVAAERADSLLVVRRGHVEESGPAADVLRRPESDYTRHLLADAPSMQALLGQGAGLPGAGPQGAEVPGAGLSSAGPTGSGLPSAGPAEEAEALLEVSGLTQVYARVPRGDEGAQGEHPTSSAAPGAGDSADADAEQIIGIEDVNFSVPRGTTLGLVGESGSGKSTIGRALTGFLTPQSGSIRVGDLDASHLDRRSLRDFRRRVQLVHQNPASALDPAHTVGASVEEPLRNFRMGGRDERRDRVKEAFERVALDPALTARRPRELSGGQLQRVAIARALVIEPELVVFDEAVSALDVTVQAQILALIDRLQQELGLTYVFISHDLAVVRQVAHSVTVMSAGRQVESGPVDSVFSDPQRAYTQRLLAAIPRPLDTQILDHQSLAI